MKEINKKIAAWGIALTMMAGVSGCSNTKTKKNSPVGYKVESTTESENGLYTYVFNTGALVSDKYNFPDNKSFVKVSKREEYGTNVLNEQTDGFYRKNIKFVLPDCYATYDHIVWYNTFDKKMIYEKIDDGIGDPYIVVYASLTASRNFSTNQTLYKDGQLPIKKGDAIYTTSIYYNGELVGFKQTGIGSDCENVKNSVIGDVDSALIPVDLDETKTVNFDELNEIEESLNQKETVKTLTLR